MGSNTKSKIAVLLGIVIAIADIYWIYTSYYYLLWVALGIIILAADIVWLFIDWSFMKK